MKGIITFIITLFVVTTSVSAQNTSFKPFSNPAFMYGTDLGQYMQTLYKLDKFDEMVKFTSSETIKKYGIHKVKKYYETCDFGYFISLVSVSNVGKYKILSYNARIGATNRVIRIKVSIESDTSKVVLDNLKFTYGM